MTHENEVTGTKTIAERVGELCEAYLSPPYLGGMAGGSQMEAEAIDRWRARLGQALAMELVAIGSKSPEAISLVQFLQYRLRFVPGEYPSTEATPEVLAKYMSESLR